MRLALCQLNASVGAIADNAGLISERLAAARAAGAELVAFPELALTGYPPEDLLLRRHFLDDTLVALEALAREVRDTTAIVGYPELHHGHLYNAAAVLADRAIAATYRKRHLPNYGVFDEQRYFTAGGAPVTIEAGGARVGLTVCEDLWRAGPPAIEEARAGARLIVNISASPYHAGKGAEREQLFAQRARECHAFIAFCAMVGGQDELVFDGHSFVLDPAGTTVARAPQFAEDILIVDLDPSSPSSPPDRARLQAPIEPVEAEVYAALVLGLHDYVEKNGFAGVVLGLSGGIDSALVACLAVDALGAERVNVAIMPSPYSSAETQADAHALAAALGVRTHELPIAAAMDAYTNTLASDFRGREPDITEENLQARIRGNLLMALSNKFGWLVLTTGNKSEMSVGYTTLYGDLAGGFAVIKDVPKTLVYGLCRWRNAARADAPIPASIIARAPSAELRPDQRDVDSLPDYELLDRILQGYIERDQGREQLIAAGLPEREVDRTIRLVDLAEYKRRQAPPGIKVTTRAFGRDRRMPITNRYRG
ncbi:MAG TPA: NAD+ synthase [Solirubrobacteraceae bacterium]|nr:NAD+ synthase [Solirubrobacteraceae bacterium]